jgi:hypothetical protein
MSLDKASPSLELISQRAYELYQSRGGQHGRDFEDWLQAEQDVLSSIALAEVTISEVPIKPKRAPRKQATAAKPATTRHKKKTEAEPTASAE